MDSVRAYQLAAKLASKSISTWKVGDLIGWGKSAAVFKAERDGRVAALKVFDSELIEAYGLQSQLSRIERELGLVGEHCDGLIEVLDGGYCKRSECSFVVMELLSKPWVCVSDVFKEARPERIGPLIAKVASAARWLEDRNLAHRDIKPQNLMVTDDWSDIKLLDLGVLRPIGSSSVTDQTGKPFIGTLQYGPPEFLLRLEEDTTLGWRAITYYQLGGVLHDLIMKRTLFEHAKEPYGRLVHAIQNEKPLIRERSVDQSLVVLTQNCLVKDPAMRLELVSWDSFDGVAHPPDNSVETIRERVHSRSLAAKQEQNSNGDAIRREYRNGQILETALDAVVSHVRMICVGDSSLPTVEIRKISSNKLDTRSFIATFSPSLAACIPDGLLLSFTVEIQNFDDQVCSVRATASLDQPSATEPRSSELVFHGILSDAVREGLIEFIYRAVDRAQSQAD